MSETTGGDAAAGAPRCWIAVVSRAHVRGGVEGGFAQACHGRAAPLRRMGVGDWLAFYSPAETLGGAEPCRAFTAVARVTGAGVYEHEMAADFVPWRRDVRFYPGAREAPIAPLLGELSFIPDRRRWGFPFRRGHFEVPAADMARIAAAMGIAFGAADGG